MSTEQNKNTDIRWVEAINAINSGDMISLSKLADDIYAPDSIYHNPLFPDIGQGPEATKQFMGETIKNHPDFHILVEDIFSGGDKVVSRGMVTGTNISTGEHLNLHFIHISKYANGKIVEEWELDAPDLSLNSIEENKKIVLQWIETVNTRDLVVLDKLADEIYLPNYVLHDPGLPDFGQGPEAMKQFMYQIIKDYPDLHVSLDDVFAEGDRVASRSVITGTNATTGESLNLLSLVISRFSGGMIAEEWELDVPTLAMEKM